MLHFNYKTVKTPTIFTTENLDQYVVLYTNKLEHLGSFYSGSTLEFSDSKNTQLEEISNNVKFTIFFVAYAYLGLFVEILFIVFALGSLISFNFLELIKNVFYFLCSALIFTVVGKYLANLINQKIHKVLVDLGYQYNDEATTQLLKQSNQTKDE